MDDAMMEKKSVRLNRQQKIENLFFKLGNLAAMFGTIHWYLGLCWHTRTKHNRFPDGCACIELFGPSPTDGQAILKGYGISSAYGSLQWSVVRNEVGLRFRLLVSAASFDYADAILAQHAGPAFEVISKPGNKRDWHVGLPYANRQAAKTAKKRVLRTVKKR